MYKEHSSGYCKLTNSGLELTMLNRCYTAGLNNSALREHSA